MCVLAPEATGGHWIPWNWVIEASHHEGTEPRSSGRQANVLNHELFLQAPLPPSPECWDYMQEYVISLHGAGD